MATLSLRYPHLFCVRSVAPPCNRCIYLKRRSGNFIKCSDSPTPAPNRGFGPKSRKPDKKNTKSSPTPKQSSTVPNQAPGLNSPTGRERNYYASSDDLDFEQRLQNVRRLALEQKKTVEEESVAIDYDAPTKTNTDASGLGVKVGVGVAVIAFGLVFAFGDIVPSGSVNPTEEAAPVRDKISEKERTSLVKRLKEFEGTLSVSPEDPVALEGASVTLAELGEYTRAAQLLEKLTEKQQTDPDAFRLLGEVKYEIKDYEGSVVAYKNAEKASKSVNIEILSGLTNSLLAADKPGEVVSMQ